MVATFTIRSMEMGIVYITVINVLLAESLVSKKYCEDCSDGNESCSSEEIQIEPLTHKARRVWGKSSPKDINESGLLFGAFLGLIRGSAMCGRLVLLLPLATKGTFINSLIIGIAFALSSTIYPVLIMLSADYLLRVVKYR